MFQNLLNKAYSQESVDIRRHGLEKVLVANLQTSTYLYFLHVSFILICISLCLSRYVYTINSISRYLVQQIRFTNLYSILTYDIL